MKIKRLISLALALCLTFGIICVTAAADATDCTHSYSGACDAECNECGAIRLAVEHYFENSEDDVCDECGISRKANVPGDVNGDGVVTNKDFSILRQYINGWNVTIDEVAADVNADGAVTNKDMSILRQYINGWDVTLKDPQPTNPDIDDDDDEDNWLDGWY